MKFIKDLVEIEDLTSRNASPNALPPSGMDAIQKSIRDGVKPDKETGQYQEWANALHLVHKAYQVNGIQRPVPNMKDAWKQYEENIEYAVKQLAKTHGMDASWRMSSSVFREAFQMAKGEGLEMEVTDNENTVSYTVTAETEEELIATLKESAKADGYKVKVLHEDDKKTITFWRNNVKKKGFSVTLRS